MSSPRTASIRQTDEHDSTTLATLRRAWSEEQTGHPLEDDLFEDDFAQWYAAEASRRVTFVAELDGEAIGMMNLALFERMPKPGRPPSRWAYLGNAFVLAAHRNRGIGTTLLNATIAHARDQHCARIVLSPSERSVAFYQRAGFGPATMLLAHVLDVQPQGTGARSTSDVNR
ncbi:GNAT family N-acetyltransferase [Lentzea cavernae]|uniref:N-acetyltransferase n=1 Tax=Lentzea cavernae TaxID=2020703 RepID=A0ABQ3MT72_9PSEU|nr:GNAT family N-acetyltransferase [Lentzea cavernae]GHH61504.1 N-acetyltransferase [Lentzea cavernae]